MYNARSTALLNFGGDNSVLTVTFVPRNPNDKPRTYQYFGVDMAAFAGLASAESRGRYFNRNIRNNPSITYAEVQ